MSAFSKAKGLQTSGELPTRISRLRNVCDGVLVTSEPQLPRDAARPSVISNLLKRCDGADIIKKNAARRKKYLVAFPGGVALGPGARLGMLHGLDSSTPTLDVQYPEGRLRMYGVLVFPRNPMLTLKCSTSKDRPVQCADTFETIILFSRWAWIGDEVSNPGNLPQPLPTSLLGNMAHPVWRTARKSSAPKSTLAADSDGIPPRQNNISVEEQDGTISGSSPVDFAEDDKIDDDDESVQWNPIKNPRKGRDKGDEIAPAPVRSNPMRARRPDFTKLFAESSDDDIEVGDSAENEDDEVQPAEQVDDVMVDGLKEASEDGKGVHDALLIDAVHEGSGILSGNGRTQKGLPRTSADRLSDITTHRRLRARVVHSGSVSLHNKNGDCGNAHVQGAPDQNEDDDGNDDSDSDNDPCEDDSGDDDYMF
jgi:hypothetical protein